MVRRSRLRYSTFYIVSYCIVPTMKLQCVNHQVAVGPTFKAGPNYSLLQACFHSVLNFSVQRTTRCFGVRNCSAQTRTALDTAHTSATPHWNRHSVVTVEHSSRHIGLDFIGLCRNWLSQLHFRFSHQSISGLSTVLSSDELGSARSAALLYFK